MSNKRGCLFKKIFPNPSETDLISFLYSNKCPDCDSNYNSSCENYAEDIKDIKDWELRNILEKRRTKINTLVQ